MKSKRQVIALIIWWCEGTKLRRDYRWKNAYLYSIEVINCDPKIIKIFKDFLVEDLNVPLEKLHGQIQIHEGDNQKERENYWEKEIGIPQEQFNKTIIRKKGNKIGKNKGTFKLRVYNKKLYQQLKGLLDKELEILNRGVAQLA